jgi:uncharacterized protein YukE
MQGMDVEYARDAAHRMDQGASDVSNLVQQIGALLDEVEWYGDDAKSFHSDFKGSFMPQLGGVVDALRENAAVLNRRADAQEQISG